MPGGGLCDMERVCRRVAAVDDDGIFSTFYVLRYFSGIHVDFIAIIRRYLRHILLYRRIIVLTELSHAATLCPLSL